MLDQTPKKSDDIAQQLASRIVRCEVLPGEKLRQDLVAREFGVSQVTVREAFLRLEGQGLVISLPRRGTCVASMDQKTAEELKVMRVALEPVALERSVPNLTPEQVQDIEDAPKQAAEPPGLYELMHEHLNTRANKRVSAWQEFHIF